MENSPKLQHEILEELDNKIDNITQFASKAYFNKALKQLARKHFENASIICNYIIAEQIEINIKPSTMEGKIKILIWLSNFHSGKSFKRMTKLPRDIAKIDRGGSVPAVDRFCISSNYVFVGIIKSCDGLNVLHCVRRPVYYFTRDVKISRILFVCTEKQFE